MANVESPVSDEKYVLNADMRKAHLGKQRCFRKLVRDKTAVPPQMMKFVRVLEYALDYAVKTTGTGTQEEKRKMMKCLDKIKYLENIVIRVLVGGEDLATVVEVTKEKERAERNVERSRPDNIAMKSDPHSSLQHNFLALQMIFVMLLLVLLYSV